MNESYRLALFGHPVAHSLSPQMHNHWLQAAGFAGGYEAISVPEVAGFQIKEEMIRRSLTGANITIPLKEHILEHVDTLGDTAVGAGAVNTVVWDGDMLVGHNTDGEGFCASLEASGVTLNASMKVVLLGAGGAARGILAALVSKGIYQVTILNRTEARARRLADRHSAHSISWGPLTQSAFQSLGEQADLVIQTTAGEGIANVATWSLESVHPCGVWADLNYWMEDPPQRENCTRSGRVFVSGLGMLVHQAALSFEYFTGKVPNPASFLARVR